MGTKCGVRGVAKQKQQITAKLGIMEETFQVQIRPSARRSTLHIKVANESGALAPQISE